MKTVIKRLVVWAVIVAALAGIATGVTACSNSLSATGEKAYEISRAHVALTVQPDGSVSVAEQLTFRYSGSFSGAYRDIPLEPGVRVSGVRLSDPEQGTYEPGGATALGSFDQPGKVGTELSDGLLRVVWHYRQQDGSRTFTLRYRVRNVARRYDDALIVPWAIWGDQWAFRLADLTARVSVAEPRSGSGRPLQVWARPRDLGATSAILGDAATYRAESVPSHTQVAVTTAFPLDAFARKTTAARSAPGSGIDATQQAEEQDGGGSLLRRIGDRLWRAQWAVSLLLAALLASTALLLYLLGREVKVAVPKHLPGPPEPLSPAVGYALAHEGEYDENVVLATLLDLVDRGWFVATPSTGKKLDLVLARPATPPEGELEPYEERVHDFFGQLVDQGPCELGKLKDRIPKHSASWRKRWEAMNEALRTAEGEAIRWDRDYTGQRALLAVVGVLATALLCFLIGLRSGEFGVPLVCGLAGVGLVVLLPGVWLKRRDPDSMRRGAEWAAFERWTRDFPRLHDDPPSTLLLWRRILVYAVAFGTAERVAKSGRIPAAVMQEDQDTWSSPLTHGASYWALSGASFGSGFSSQVAPESSSSSGGGGGGGGGGFSGGGGGGAW